MKKFLANSIFILFIFAPGNFFPQNFNDALRLSEPGLGSNARALAMGNSYIAVSDDYSGTIFNPAGIGLVKRMELSGSMLFNSFDNSASLFGNTTGYSNSTTTMSQFGFIFPMPTVQGSLVFGMGFNQLKNFNDVSKFDGFNTGGNSMIQELLGKDNLAWELYLTDKSGDNTPINGKLNQSGTIIKEGSLDSWAFSGSIEMAENLFVGATLNILSGDFKYNREYYEDDTKNIYDASVKTDPDEPSTADFRTFYFNDMIDWNISGWDLKLGFLYRLPLRGSLAATIKFPSSFTIEEKFFVDASSSFGTGSEYYIEPYEDKIEYDISTPFEFQVGGSFFINTVLLSGQIGFTNYSDMEFTDGLGTQKENENNKEIKDLFDTSLNYNFGIEYTFPVLDISVRAGYMQRQSPFNGDPSEFDKKYLTGGIGIILNDAMALDFAYAHGWWKDISDNYGSGLSRISHDITSDNIIFTFSYRY